MATPSVPKTKAFTVSKFNGSNESLFEFDEEIFKDMTQAQKKAMNTSFSFGPLGTKCHLKVKGFPLKKFQDDYVIVQLEIIEADSTRRVKCMNCNLLLPPQNSSLFYCNQHVRMKHPPPLKVSQKLTNMWTSFSSGKSSSSSSSSSSSLSAGSSKSSSSSSSSLSSSSLSSSSSFASHNENKIQKKVHGDISFPNKTMHGQQFDDQSKNTKLTSQHIRKLLHLKLLDPKLVQTVAAELDITDHTTDVRAVLPTNSQGASQVVACDGISWGGETPFSLHYPHQLHARNPTPSWTYTSKGRLHATNCNRVVPAAVDTTTAIASPSMCVNCSLLEENRSLVNVMERSYNRELYRSHINDDFLNDYQKRQRCISIST